MKFCIKKLDFPGCQRWKLHAATLSCLDTFSGKVQKSLSSHTKRPSRGDRCEFIQHLYIAEIYRTGAICLLLTVYVYLHSLLHTKFRKKRHIGETAHCCRSRSFKVIEIGTNRQSYGDLLLVANSNLNHVPKLRDTATNIRNFYFYAVISHQSRTRLRFLMWTAVWHLISKIASRASRRFNHTILRSIVSNQYRRVPDGQTDRQADKHVAYR